MLEVLLYSTGLSIGLCDCEPFCGVDKSGIQCTFNEHLDAWLATSTFTSFFRLSVGLHARWPAADNAGSWCEFRKNPTNWSPHVPLSRRFRGRHNLNKIPLGSQPFSFGIGGLSSVEYWMYEANSFACSFCNSYIIRDVTIFVALG